MSNSNPEETFDLENAKLFTTSLTKLVDSIVGVEEIRQADINRLLTTLINLIPSITITGFELDRATIPIPSYRPGVFPENFIGIRSIKELDTIVSQSLATSFIIEVKGLSRIKAKGFGELDLYKEGDRIEVKAKDLWFIEEVLDIEPKDDKLPQRVSFLQRIIKEVVLDLIAKILVAFLNK
jgi:hypothetical protein